MAKFDELETIEEWKNALEDLLDQAGAAAARGQGLGDFQTDVLAYIKASPAKCNFLDKIAVKAANDLVEQEFTRLIASIAARKQDIETAMKTLNSATDGLRKSESDLKFEQIIEALHLSTAIVEEVKQLRADLADEDKANLDKAIAAAKTANDIRKLVKQFKVTEDTIADGLSISWIPHLHGGRRPMRRARSHCGERSRQIEQLAPAGDARRAIRSWPCLCNGMTRCDVIGQLPPKDQFGIAPSEEIFMTVITAPIAPGAMRVRRRSTLRLMTAGGAVIIAALVAMPVVSADRLPGKEVMALLDRIDNERDRFEDQLDGKIKNSIIQGAGEVHVERFLDDLQENVDRLKSRFNSDYAASAEATTVLRQGSDIQRFMSKQPPDLDGASEWNRLASSLGELAKVYATKFPLPEGQQARRLSDSEVEKVASELAESADRFKKDLESALKTNTTIDQPTKDAAVKEVNSLKEDAEELASTVGDGRPASGEAKAVLDRAARIRGAAASSGRTLSPAAQTAWGPVESGLQKVAVAFDLPAPRP